MKKKLCKLCRKRSDFVDAHIIPQNFNPDRDKAKDALLIFSSDSKDRIRRSRTGIYDQQLVCGECERSFSAADDYAGKFLINQRDKQNLLLHQSKIYGFRIEKFDYVKLKLFFISLLWRAAASDRAEFSRVKLGPFMLPLRKLVLEKNPGEPEVFSVTLTRFSDVDGWESGFISPYKEKHSDVNFYRFLLREYVALIKVDKRRTPEPFASLMLRQNAPLVMPAGEFRESVEFRAFLRLAKINAPKRRS